MGKKTVLIGLVILVLGLVGAGFSALYQRNEFIRDPRHNSPSVGTIKVYYGFPLAWYGYTEGGIGFWGYTIKVYWFSLGSFLVNTLFWSAVGLFVSFAAIKSARALNLVGMARASMLGMKTSLILVVMSLSFLIIGVSLCVAAQASADAFDRMEGYLDVGLRLVGSGMSVLIATVSVMLWKPRSQKDACLLGARA
jgi:hypothetical protein